MITDKQKAWMKLSGINFCYMQYSPAHHVPRDINNQLILGYLAWDYYPNMLFDYLEVIPYHRLKLKFRTEIWKNGNIGLDVCSGYTNPLIRIPLFNWKEFLQ